jgi:cytochrome c oxidase assembly factor CtaG
VIESSIGSALLRGEWSAEPLIALPLALTALVYARGWYRINPRAGPSGRRSLEAVAFAAGLLLLAFALLSPLHALGESLLSAHMAQHEMLMVLAAPLLVLARPIPALLWGLPIAWRRRLGRLDREPVKGVWRLLTGLGPATAIHAAAILLWHLPRLYQAGLENEAIHALQHLSFLLSALLFWHAMFHGAAARQQRGAAILFVTLTSVSTGALGMLLTFARAPVYPLYLERTAVWGLTPLDDQRLAGLIMWIPGGLGYLIATLILTAHWLGSAGLRRPDARLAIHRGPLPSAP